MPYCCAYVKILDPPASINNFWNIQSPFLTFKEWFTIKLYFIGSISNKCTRWNFDFVIYQLLKMDNDCIVLLSELMCEITSHIKTVSEENETNIYKYL